MAGIENIRQIDGGSFEADVTLGNAAQIHMRGMPLGGGVSQFMILTHDLSGTKHDHAAVADIAGAAGPLLSGITAGVIVHRDFCPLFANQYAVDLLGLATAADLVAMPTLLRFLPAENLAAELERHCQLMSGDPVGAPRIVRLMTHGGRDTWVEMGASVMALDGAPSIVLTLTDVNEQVRAREREALLRDAVDDLSDSFILYDSDDRVVLTNKRFHEVFPFLAVQDEIVGMSMVDLVRHNVEAGAVTDPSLDDMEDEDWIKTFIEARRVNKLVLAEDTWPDGRWDLVKEQRLESGGFVSVRTDITDRKQAEFALMNQEAQLELALAERTKHLSAVLSNVAQGVLVVDPDLRVVLTNQGFHDLLECPKSMGVPGTHVRNLIADRVKRGYMFPEELASDADQATLVEQRLESYRPLARERFRHISVGDRTLEVHREKLSDGTTICTYTDITDRIRAEREVERQREALHQSEKLSALGMLLAGVAHELNNPLQVVLGNAALLESDSVDREQIKRAGTIRDAAERCAKIIKTFLAMARDAPASKEPVDLNELVGRSLNLIGHQLHVRDIEIELDLSPTLPQVIGDPDQLSQVIVNLLLNAMQAMEKSDAPRLLMVQTLAGRMERGVELKVSDTGPGVPKDIRGRIFDPFFTTKPVGLGTGIGLAVCHAMAVAHGGTITIDETQSGGALFIVRLPHGGAEGEVAQPASPVDSAGLADRVLIVDNDQEIRELLSDILESTGLQVEMAASGHEALELIANHRYAAILCDLGVPGLDGPGLYGEESLGRFIFATGDLLNEATDRFLSQVERPCLGKPFLPEQVRHIVSEVAAQEKDKLSTP